MFTIYSKPVPILLIDQNPYLKSDDYGVSELKNNADT